MERLDPYPDEKSEKTERSKKQNKKFCLGIGSGATNTFKAMVMVEQLTSQWAVSKGHQ